MKDLFYSEFRRFRSIAWIVAVVHLLALQFFNRMSDLLQMTYSDAAPLFALYVLIGLVLAIMQVGSYRKPSQWLWLMHRPLSPQQIFAALALSALALLMLTLVLPMLIVVLATDVLSTKVVDARHYLAIVHLLAFAMMAWLAGAYACVSRYKAAIAVMVAPLILSLHLVSVWWLLLPVSLALLWLMWITLNSFRANREAPLQSNITLLITALPLQLALFLVVFELGAFLFLTGSIMVGTDPLNTEFPPKGGVIESLRAEPKKAMVFSLEGSSDSRAPSWREQLPLMEPTRLGPYVVRVPIRHQLSNLNVPTQWYDETHKIMWTFSHDRMLFHGRNPESGIDHGWWGLHGAGDTTPFVEVPMTSHEGYLMTGRALYAIDDDQHRQHEIVQLPAGEWFVDVPRREFNRVLVLTNLRVLAYRTDRDSVSSFAPLLLDWQLPLPHGVAQHEAELEYVDIAELMDGWLVSTLYGEGIRQIGFTQFSHYTKPSQQVFFIDDEGRSTLVNTRAINRDYPLLQTIDWWFSPLLHVLVETPDSLLNKGLTWPLQSDPLPNVPLFYPIAITLMLLSLVLAVWWLRGARLSRQRRAMWLASCAIIGLPAFFSLMLLEPRVPHMHS